MAEMIFLYRRKVENLFPVSGGDSRCVVKVLIFLRKIRRRVLLL
jgi:hypothetical protein